MPDNKNNNLEKELHKYGFSRRSNAENILAVLTILGFVTGIVALLIYGFRVDKVSWSDAFMPLISLGAAIVAFQQWRENRYEISIDKYYDRLESANKRLECLDIPKEKMHVYVELDKLEYVIVKYELGFIPAKFAKRAIDNF